MINRIKNKLKDDLVSQVGTDSTLYTDLLVENIDTRIQDPITTPLFIGIDATLDAPEEYEIAARQAPTLNQYSVIIAILVKDATYASGQEKLDKVYRRIWRAIYTMNERKNLGQTTTLWALNTLGTIEGIQERFTNIVVTNVALDSNILEPGLMGHLALMTLKVRTEIVSVSAT